jgi:hypothetical protein
MLVSDIATTNGVTVSRARLSSMTGFTHDFNEKRELHRRWLRFSFRVLAIR